MHGEKYGEDLETIPVPNKTIMRRTESLSEEFKEHLQTRIKCNPKYPLQVDELADFAGVPELLVSVRYSFEEKNFWEEFMFRLSLSERCPGSDIFKVVSQSKAFVVQTASAFVQAEQ
jgi:hypothetical protein